jgi:NADPH:quinone reductase-like Zn-dependent oxidoreductase
VVPATFLAPKPRTLDHVESAAIPLAALSAWQGLFTHGHLAEGQRVLVHGAAGGVGGFAVQLAHRCGAQVVGTASTGNLDTARRPNREQLVELAGLADGGDLRPTIDQVFPLADARKAFERSLGDHRGGKIVLRVI